MDRIVIGNKTFETLVALSEEEQCQGLMYRPWPPPIMTFPFKKADIHKFWMRNTISPLDIIFCQGGKVVEMYKGEPLSLKLVGPDAMVDMVVEMPAGTVEKCGINKGDSVDIKYSLGTLAKKFEE